MAASAPPAAAAGSAAAAPGPGGGFLKRVTETLRAHLAYLLELYQSGWRFRWLMHALLGLGVVFLAARALHRRYLAKYRSDLTSTATEPEYDYIVVGGGSSGAALAARLAEQDPALTVLLLEAGGSDDVLNIDVPAAAMKLQRKAASDWLYQTEPQTHAHGSMLNRCGFWPRGKVLGGSSSLNYMLFVRGAPQDFDSWAAGGAGDEWNYQSVLPYFQRLENIRAEENDIPASPMRGANGPMPCRSIVSPQPATRAFIEAASSSGILPLNPDYNSGSILGVGMSQYNVKGGKRINTATAYVAPALLTRKNLHVLCHAHVQRVVFNDAKEAQGVAVKRGTDAAAMRQQPETFFRARREVIICGGAINSPQLLELSGVGQCSLLESLGIPVVADRPGVGENLQDHIVLPLLHESRVSTLSAADENLRNVWEWLRHGRGPLTGNMVEALAWIKTSAHAGARIGDQMPDIQYHWLAGTISPNDFEVFNSKPELADKLRALVTGGIMHTHAILPTLLHPRSRGYVHISSRCALSPPRIQPNYLHEQADVDSLVAGVKAALHVYAQPAMAAITGRCLADDMVPHNPYSMTAQPEQYWEFYARAHCNTLYHPVGTCKIGAPQTDPLAVVDSRLRVIGVRRLRVADASVMPHLVSGNTNVPAIMIGEKCADMIRAAREGKEEPQQMPPGHKTDTKSKL